MSDPSQNGIHLTKEYYKDFILSDLQWTISKINDDFTLYDLFRLVYQIEIIIPGISTTFGMSQFSCFWDQINCNSDPDDDSNMTHLELYWSPDYDTRTTKKTGKPTDQSTCSFMKNDTENHWDDHKICEMSNLMALHGRGPGCPMRDLDFHDCGDDCPKETSYAIEMTPVNNLGHLPIRVLPKVSFFPPYVESDREFHRTGFQLKIDPTLWCFITSIFWELTFYGSSPDEVADKRQEISDSIDKVKKQFRNSTDANDLDGPSEK